MPKVNEIRTALFEAAPEYMKMEWDNVGLMCGHAAQEVTRVLVALDASYRVLNEAKAAHCYLGHMTRTQIRVPGRSERGVWHPRFRSGL